jgi:hypothetical protein
MKGSYTRSFSYHPFPFISNTQHARPKHRIEMTTKLVQYELPIGARHRSTTNTTPLVIPEGESVCANSCLPEPFPSYAWTTLDRILDQVFVVHRFESSPSPDLPCIRRPLARLLCC